MSISKSRMQFHQTFPPQAQYISEILRLAAKDYSGTVQEISELTGIPTGKQKGKVKPHIEYSKYMGLIDFNLGGGIYTLSLTDVGRIVYENDPYLLAEETKLLCHYYICDNQYGAPQWRFLFKNIAYAYDKPVSAQFIQSKVNDAYDMEVSLGVVKSSYLGGMFDELELLEWTTTINHVSKDMHYSMINLYAYTLMDMWERYINEKKEVTVDDITIELRWGDVFGFDADVVMRILDELEELGIVAINRQLIPASVIKLSGAQEQLYNIYSM